MRERAKREQPTAWSKAVALLARREHSARELRRKLTERGYSADEADDALQRLADDGYQDDGRFAEMLVRTRISSGQGPARIRAELATHDIDAEHVDAAFDANEADWSGQARSIIERRYSGQDLRDARLRRKAIEFLMRRGFCLDVARAATLPTVTID